MGQQNQPEPNAEIAAWLNAGGQVVASSERAARALAAAFHRARRAEGLDAWPAPAIFDWQTFLRTAAQDQSNSDARLLLNPLQEQSLWAAIAGSDTHLATLLEGPRNRMAHLAMQAHSLLCSYAPDYLCTSARAAWQADAENFSTWLAAFDETCRAAKLLSPARLPLELIPRLEANPAARPPLLLAGFDRILTTQRRLFDAWGAWQQASLAAPSSNLRFYAAADTQSELAACALWSRSQLAANPGANLLVIAQDLAKRRGEIERAFQNLAGAPTDHPLFEFSLGIPLAQVALPRGAHLLLRWLTGPIDENELDWLLSTGQTAADPQETAALQTSMRSLRRRGLERTRWSLGAFIAQLSNLQMPSAWAVRLAHAQRLLKEDDLLQSPLQWAEVVPRILEAAGWPGARPLSSVEFQSLRRWQQTLESCATLGFDGRRISWPNFLSILARTLEETLFAPESRDAPIQIAGPAESAGLTADGLWFMGASQDSWPSAGTTNPLLPLWVQRTAAMPHATTQLDWELAHSITARLLGSAPQVNFSFARLSEDVETHPSRLITQFAGPHQRIPAELTIPSAPQQLTVPFEDFSQIPFPAGKVEGGSGVLTAQSQCPFKAFANARLGAQSWQPAEAGLTAAQRGQLLHAVLHAVWAGPPRGLRTLDDLQSLENPAAFVANLVGQVLAEQIGSALRDRLPRRYLELEAQRLSRLVTEWLRYESIRIPFTVVKTEARQTIALAGLTFDVRLDRIDRLNDNSLLVIDYKTGLVSPKLWEPPRPDDVQLPLYAGFALDPDEELGGLAFARVRSGKAQGFTGHVGDASARLLPNLTARSALVKNKFTAEQLLDWRDTIEQLAADFLAGRAEVDPRDYPNTCEYCGLESLCRIAENRALLDPAEDPGDDSSDPDLDQEDGDD